MTTYECLRDRVRTQAFVKMLGEASIQLCGSAPQHGVRRRPTTWAEMVAWVERALDLGLEGELFPSEGELNAAVTSFS